MSLFSSRRERRLWLWTLAVVAAIYLTLGSTGTLAAALRARGLIEAASVIGFALGMLLVAAAIVTHGIKVRLGGTEIAVGLAVVAAYGLVVLRMTSPEERSHMIEYGVLAVLIYEALGERASHGRRVPWPAVLAALGTAGLGLVDEGIQWFIPNRVFDWQDVLFNLLAGTMAIGASATLAWARRRTSRPRRTDDS